VHHQGLTALPPAALVAIVAMVALVILLLTGH
jgi:hypothetical protein